MAVQHGQAHAGAPHGVVPHGHLDGCARRHHCSVASGAGQWSDGAEIGRWLVAGHNAESVELGDNADVGLTLRHHLELGWPEVDVVGFLTGLLGHVRDWVVMPLADDIGRASKTP